MKSYIYILRCADGSLYTGWTNSITARVEQHNKGKGAKYTRQRLPVKLVYVEEFSSRGEAMAREYEIKKMPRAEKLRLANSNP